MNRVAVLATAVWSCFVAAAFAQDAVPREILERTIFIKIGDMTGTAFTIDHKAKLYLVTARHLASGLPETNATIQVRRAGTWEDFHTVRTLFPSHKDADIAVFETNEKISRPFEVTTLGNDEGVTMGQQVWFLGYPFGGMGSPISGSDTVIPFMKRGTMSAIDGTNPDAVILYIDGFNNPGFSGGPIVLWSFASHTYKIVGVVKGFRNDTAKALINGQQVDTQILVNSGILVGYSIKHVIEAIEKSHDQQPQ